MIFSVLYVFILIFLGAKLALKLSFFQEKQWKMGSYEFVEYH